jgi:hypothetical protein
MRPGKRRPSSKQEKVEVPRIAPEPAVESSPGPAIVPVNLLAALEKMRSGGAVPVFITKELEKFLTEQGVYRDDMRPAEAWEKLNEIAGNAPEPEPPAAS